MRRMAMCIVLLFILFSTVLTTSADSEPLLLSDSEMARIVGQGWCGFFNGFSVGLGTSALVAGFVPGGQGYAVGAGAAAAFIKLGVTVAC